MIGEASSGMNSGGIWIAGAIAALGGIPGVVAIFSIFATRREQDALVKRQDHSDATIAALRKEIHEMETRLSQEGEKRAVALHDRTNEILSAVSEVRGELRAYRNSQ